MKLQTILLCERPTVQKIVDKYEGMKPGKPVKHEKKEVAVVEGSDTGAHSTAGAEE